MARPALVGSRQFDIITLLLVTIFSCAVFCATNNVRNAAAAQPTDNKDAVMSAPVDSNIWVPYTTNEGKATDSFVIYSNVCVNILYVIFKRHVKLY